MDQAARSSPHGTSAPEVVNWAQPAVAACETIGSMNEIQIERLPVVREAAAALPSMVENEPNVTAAEDRDFARVVESAIIVNWNDLLGGPKDGLVHVEYRFASNGLLNNLEVWKSTVRGYWLLAGTYSMPPAPLIGTDPDLKSGIQSKDLGFSLNLIMQHQSLFILPENLGPHGLLQIETPAPEQRLAAADLLGRALARVETNKQ